MKILTLFSNKDKAVDFESGKGSKENSEDLSLEEFLAPLREDFRAALLSMYNGDAQFGNDDQKFTIDEITRISAGDGMALYDLAVATKAKNTIEIGMAYGFSTICFLAAIAKNGAGHHTSIDPFQRSHWNGIGLAHAMSLAPMIDGQSSFTFLDDRSDRVSADLARAEEKFDLIFIDGNHRYDDVLVDFYLFAQICEAGGHIVFDDMWMSSVQTVVSFIETNRVDFVRVRNHSRCNQAIFRKIAEDERPWDDFQPFTVSLGGA